MKYSYNGVVLPPLPEWDRKKYPYAVLSYFNPTGEENDYCHLYVVTAQPALKGAILYKPDDAESKKYSLTSIPDGIWVDEGVMGTNFCGMKNSLVWSNVDILSEDGEIYLPASHPIDIETGEEITDYDPVPVDPPAVAPEVEPKSFMAGWRMGQFVRAML